jgi:hypothetical protein
VPHIRYIDLRPVLDAGLVAARDPHGMWWRIFRDQCVARLPEVGGEREDEHCAQPCSNEGTGV